MPFSCRRRQDPFYDKGEEKQREPRISVAADQALPSWTYTLGPDALRKMINDNGMTLGIIAELVLWHLLQ